MTEHPPIYETGLTCPLCRRHYTAAKPVRFLARYGLCLTCWTKADPDRRRQFDPFRTPTHERPR